MERVVIDDLSSSPSPDADRRGLTGPLGATDAALNQYRIPPGDGFPSGLHTHVDQEEIFVVLDGEATFETLPERDGPVDRPRTGRVVTVESGEAIRFAPGEYQSGHNRSDGDLVALAIGAPRDSEDVRVPVACPDCERADFALDTGGETLSFVCPDCGAERVPAPCPDCGADAMTLGLDDENEVVAACDECGAEFDRPPYRT
ncbi:cupin domain-containing protein [Halosimplex salinum]|uniref:cupin domain-containing protein n=1 Tax=Halosimplex salinum TaxID=1710538 RepID=UPI000F493261|nr:cupin domain-containing protein [Halosimplex salinum]